ncbi:MAG: hypothetical protein IJF33_03835, partial [Clostridia bacterium]|nr:hypothetical protein [Clostridia bacterium]
MHFSLLFSTGWGAGSSGTGFLVAIAVMACVLGAEIAGICILISKMLRARRAKLEQERIEEDEERNASYRNYSVLGLPLLMGAILPTVYITLNILTVLTVAAAVVFLFLLILCRACGYDFASAKRRSEETVAERTAETDEQPLYAEPASEDEVFATAAEAVPDESEEQRQYAYTEVEPDEEPLAAFAEEETEEETVEETEEETVKATDAEPVEDAEPVAEAEVSEPVAVVPAAAAPITTTTVEPLPQFADGTQPYKVVEKVVTETFKEVYTETPQPAAAPAQQSNPAADAVMEKLADFLDYELQKRKENDKAEEEKKTAAESVATFATSQTPEEEEDIEEEDEIDDEDDLEESEKGLSDREHDEDSDDEENDTEGDHFTGNERIIGFDEETGCYIVAHYRKSFEAKLIQSRPNIKKYYSELRNALLSYKGTKNRISWTADSFHNGRTPIAKINVKTRIIELYLALDPASLEGTVYRGTDVSHIKKYVDTPFRYKLRTPRKFKWAMELI